MTTLELQNLMTLIKTQGPKDQAYVLLTAPFGKGERQFQWICNCAPEDAQQIVIDTAKIFSSGRN